MYSIFLQNVLCLLILTSYTRATSARDGFKDNSLDRGAHGDRQGLWFGPRLGKRSRYSSNDESRETFQRLIEAANVLKLFYDQLPYEVQVEEPEKVKKVFASKLELEGLPDKRTYDNVEFTPRLGRRRIADVIPATTAEEEIFRSDPVMINPMSNLFSPRLGRNSQFLPRLGRELNYDLYPDKIRVVRSTNDTKAN